MADVFTAEKRSAVMAAIRAKDTKPEVAVRRALHALGVRFRLHDGRLPGRPDIVIRRLSAIVQVKGCFWHGHRCLKGRVPGVNRPYWSEKISGNRARDARNERRLRSRGWRVHTVWECTVRRSTGEELSARLRRLLRTLKRRGAGGRRARGARGTARRLTAPPVAAAVAGPRHKRTSAARGRVT